MNRNAAKWVGGAPSPRGAALRTMMPWFLSVHLTLILQLIGPGADLARLASVCQQFNTICRRIMAQREICVIVGGDSTVVDVFDYVKRTWTTLPELPIKS